MMRRAARLACVASPSSTSNGLGAVSRSLPRPFFLAVSSRSYYADTLVRECSLPAPCDLLWCDDVGLGWVVVCVERCLFVCCCSLALLLLPPSCMVGVSILFILFPLPIDHCPHPPPHTFPFHFWNYPIPLHELFPVRVCVGAVHKARGGSWVRGSPCVFRRLGGRHHLTMA